MQLRESAESRPIEHGRHLREFDQPTFLNSDGKKHLRGWPTISLPYPSLFYRMLRGSVSYLIVIASIAVLLQVFTPFPVISSSGRLLGVLIGGAS